MEPGADFANRLVVDASLCGREQLGAGLPEPVVEKRCSFQTTMASKGASGPVA